MCQRMELQISQFPQPSIFSLNITCFLDNRNTVDTRCTCKRTNLKVSSPSTRYTTSVVTERTMAHQLSALLIRASGVESSLFVESRSQGLRFSFVLEIYNTFYHPTLVVFRSVLASICLLSLDERKLSASSDFKQLHFLF